MRVTKWVEFEKEVEIDIGADDIRAALSEAFARVNVRDIDDTPNRHDVTGALSSIGTFLRALTDEHIALLSPAARKTVGDFLATQAARFHAYPAPSMAPAPARTPEAEDGRGSKE